MYVHNFWSQANKNRSFLLHNSQKNYETIRPNIILKMYLNIAKKKGKKNQKSKILEKYKQTI